MNIIAESPPRDNPIPSEEKYRSIAALNVAPGIGDLICTLDLKIGGLTIRQICVRRGRKDVVYVNFPRARIGDKWVDVIEVTSTSLLAACRQVALAAALEVIR